MVSEARTIFRAFFVFFSKHESQYAIYSMKTGILYTMDMEGLSAVPRYHVTG